MRFEKLNTHLCSHFTFGMPTGCCWRLIIGIRCPLHCHKVRRLLQFAYSPSIIGLVETVLSWSLNFGHCEITWSRITTNDSSSLLLAKFIGSLVTLLGFILIWEAHKERESEPKILLPIWSEVWWWGQEPWHSFISRHSVIFSVQMTDPLPLPYAMLT